MFTPYRIVPATEVCVEQRPGEPSRALAPGRHHEVRHATYVPVDVRAQLGLVAPQDVLTADGVSVKVTAVIGWRVVDAVRFIEAAADPAGAVYLATQVALREALAELDAAEAVHTARATVATALLDAARRAGAQVGIEVSEVVVKDVILPPDLRLAYAELVTGRQRAQAQLEAARAETAALRSLANAAKLLDDHPALARIRLVQALPPGATVRLVTGSAEV